MDEIAEQRFDKAERIRQEIAIRLPAPRTSAVAIEVRGRSGGLTKVWLRTKIRRTQPGAGAAEAVAG